MPPSIFRRAGLFVLVTGLSFAFGCASTSQTPGDPGGSQIEPVSEPAPEQTGTGAKLAEAAAQPVRLRADHPDTYTVQPGDTLWDISSKFLKDPWLWPEVWHINPAIKNPHLIYPGDVLALVYGADGKPQIRVTRGRPTVKMSPQVRETPLREAIPTIPLGDIEAFLQRSAVLSELEWAGLPYLLSGPDDRPMFATGDRIYARGGVEDRDFYVIFRPDIPYVDPDTGENLGMQGLYVGSASVEQAGDPATLTMTRSARQGQAGDRLYPIDEQFDASFLPRPGDFEGRIIGVVDGVTMVGQFSSVVLNRGAYDGAEPGQVLAVLRQGELVQDPYTKESIRTPEERSGLLIVYRVFDRVSYGLILRATHPMAVFDAVGPPEPSDL